MPVDAPVRTGERDATRAGETVTRDRIRLPLWAWAGIGALGLIVIWYFRQAHNAANANTTAADTTAMTSTGGTTLNPSMTAQTGGNLPYSIVPYPVTQVGGSSPAQMQEYQNLLDQITTLQGGVSQIPLQAPTGATGATGAQGPTGPAG